MFLKPGICKLFAFHRSENHASNMEVFHDKSLLMEDYKEINRSFMIYVYPHVRNDPFSNVLLPVDFEPQGNYANDNYFKKALMKSNFITKDPTKADLFFVPIPIARMRYDQRIGVGGIKDFVRRSAMEEADQVMLNAIQVVCSSSYFLTGYISQKDISMPQIWPRQGDPPIHASSNWKKKNSNFLWEQSTISYGKSFFIFGEVTLTSLPILVGLSQGIPINYLEANSASMSDGLESTQLGLKIYQTMVVFK